MIGNILHSGFISSIHKDNLTPWYQTTSNNEIIHFLDSNNEQRHLNSLVIYSKDTPLYVRMLPSDYCVYIEPNSFVEYNLKSTTSIQIMGNSGQSIRWMGQFY